MAAGHGGQILLADSTAGLLSGVDLVDLGPRRLRDVPDAGGVFQVRAPGLGTEFPPLRVLDTSPGNLRPQPRASSGGRPRLPSCKRDEVSSVGYVDRGGRGRQDPTGEKSRRGWAMSFPDGVWFFELAAVTDPAAVPTRWRRCWASPNNRARPWAERWPPHWRAGCGCWCSTTANTCFDAVADLVEAILAHSATVTILATSREGLGVVDEQLWPVPSLESCRIDSAAVICLSNAPAALPGLLGCPRDAAAVAEICRVSTDSIGYRVGGLAYFVDGGERGA